MKQYLEAGQAVTTHGVMGEIKLYPWCDSAETLKKVKKMYLDPDGKNTVTVLSVKTVKNMNMLKLEGCDSIEQARKYIDRVFYVDRKDLKLPQGRYFISDLIGLSVEHADTGAKLGELCDVTNNGAHDLYHVRLENGDIRMIPAVPAFVTAVDIENGKVAVRPIKGMLDDEN